MEVEKQKRKFSKEKFKKFAKYALSALVFQSFLSDNLYARTHDFKSEFSIEKNGNNNIKKDLTNEQELILRTFDAFESQRENLDIKFKELNETRNWLLVNSDKYKEDEYQIKVGKLIDIWASLSIYINNIELFLNSIKSDKNKAFSKDSHFGKFTQERILELEADLVELKKFESDFRQELKSNGLILEGSVFDPTEDGTIKN